MSQTCFPALTWGTDSLLHHSFLYVRLKTDHAGQGSSLISALVSVITGPAAAPWSGLPSPAAWPWFIVVVMTSNTLASGWQIIHIFGHSTALFFLTNAFTKAAPILMSLNPKIPPYIMGMAITLYLLSLANRHTVLSVNEYTPFEK